MSLIDQRILVIAPAEAVWTYLTNPAFMPKWNRSCAQLFILSTRATGVGARRRCIDERGRTIIEETTAWLENIGYEYVMVDGPFRTYRARIRLQAVPDGTVINWTVDYQVRGPLGGLRNMLSVRRSTTHLMADSLKRLKRLVESSGVFLDREKQARVAMQAAPDVNARAARGAEILRAEGTPSTPVSGTSSPVSESVNPTPVARTTVPVVIDDNDAPETVSPPASGASVGIPTIIHAFQPPVIQAVHPITPATPQNTPSQAQTPPSQPTPAKPEPVDPPLVAETFEPMFVARVIPLPGATMSPANVPPIAAPPEISPPPTLPQPHQQTLNADDTKPRRPEGMEAALVSMGFSAPSQGGPDSAGSNTEETSDSRDSNALTVPISMVAPPLHPFDPKSNDPESITQTMEIPINKPPETLPEHYPTPHLDASLEKLRASYLDDTPIPTETQIEMPVPSAAPAIKPPPTGKFDTGEISIWDIFGVAPPSEVAKAELEAVIASLQTPTQPLSFRDNTRKEATENLSGQHQKNVSTSESAKVSFTVRGVPIHKRRKVETKVRRPRR